MYVHIVVYLVCLSVDSITCIFFLSSLSMLSLLIFILIVVFSFSLCVDMDDILAFCLTACCMTALLMCDCMLLVYVVAHLSPYLQPSSFSHSLFFLFLHL